MRALALDFGGTHVTCGLVEDRILLAHQHLDTDRAKSLKAVLPRIKETFLELMSSQSLSAHDFGGISVGFAAIVDSPTGKILSTLGKYDDAVNIDLPAWGREIWNLPLRVENDARMALLGESYAGAARGYTDVVMMTLGTGIGGVAMIEGKLLRGKHAQAGCIGGHFPVVFDGRQCVCGAIGCAEAEASGWSLPLIAKDWPGISKSSLSKYADVGFKELFQEAQNGDEVAVAIRDRCLHVWASDAVALVHAYDPEIVVMGGGVMKREEIVIPYVESYVHKHSWTPWGKVRVCAAQLGNNAALLGAIPILTEH